MKKLILWSVALLAALEIGLRVLGLGHPLLIRPDPPYGYLPAPDQDLDRFFSHVHINSFGMRSEDIARHKPSGTKRILVIGDSVTFGTTYVDQSLIFTSRLQKDLGRGTEVLNVSAGGWATSNELGFLKARGTFDSDLVVFVLNTGDLNQPFNPFEESALMPTHNPRTAIGELLDHYILPRLRDRVLRDAGSVIAAKPSIDTETPKILAVLTEAHKVAADQGAGFAVVYAPSVVGTDRQEWARAAAMLLAWAKQQNVAIIDLSAAYAAQAAREIYLDGIHLKPLGHALMEQAFLRRYQAEPMLGKSGR